MLPRATAEHNGEFSSVSAAAICLMCAGGKVIIIFYFHFQDLNQPSLTLRLLVAQQTVRRMEERSLWPRPVIGK